MSQYDHLIQNKSEDNVWDGGVFATKFCEHFGLGQVEKNNLEMALSKIASSQRTFGEIYRVLSEEKSLHFNHFGDSLEDWYHTQEGYMRLMSLIGDHFMGPEQTHMATAFAECLM